MESSTDITPNFKALFALLLQEALERAQSLPRDMRAIFPIHPEPTELAQGLRVVQRLLSPLVGALQCASSAADVARFRGVLANILDQAKAEADKLEANEQEANDESLD